MKNVNGSRREGAVIPGWAFAALLFVFAAGVALMLRDCRSYYFGDEHFYTDSVLRMIRTGNFLTPEYPDGSSRFNKPILTYWMILAGFKSLGVSVLASRAASWLTGLMILAGTGLLVRRLGGRRQAVFMSMLVLGTNTEFITACMRATPDIFLCGSVLLSLYGFSGLLLVERPSRADGVCAYLGAGLAVASKGLLGLGLPVFAVAAACLLPTPRERLRRLVRPLPLMLGIGVASAWFVAVSLRHGPAAMAGFLQDQVGNRLASIPLHAIRNGLHYTAGLLLYFFPWSLLLVMTVLLRPVAAGRLWRRHRMPILLLSGWYAVLVLVFMPANLTRMRYLLPGLPGLAAAGALLFDAIPPFLIRHGVRVAAAGLLIGACALAWLSLTLGRPELAEASGALVLVLSIAVVSLRRRPPALHVAALSSMVFALIVVLHGWVRPVFPNTPVPDWERDLTALGVRRVRLPLHEARMGANRNLYRDKYAGQLRVVSGNGIEVSRCAWRRSGSGADPVLCMGEEGLDVAKAWTVVPSGAYLRRGLNPREFLALFSSWDNREAYRRLFTPCYILFPSPEGPEDPIPFRGMAENL